MSEDNSEENNVNIKSDYENSRETYYDLIAKGKESLDLMIEVARESEHPRAFEVLSGMIKNISDVNDRLMDLNKKNKEIVAKDNGARLPADPHGLHGIPQQVTNNVFVGSTSDFQKMLRNELNVIEGEVQNNEPDIAPKTE